jgi:hypothetical protein
VPVAAAGTLLQDGEEKAWLITVGSPPVIGTEAIGEPA